MIFSGRAVSILAPEEVSPGHMILAPLNTNLIAPLSTCTRCKMCGTVEFHTVHIHNQGPTSIQQLSASVATS